MHGGEKEWDATGTELDETVMSEKKPPHDLVFMVPKTIFGFDIQEKKWGKFR